MTQEQEDDFFIARCNRSARVEDSLSQFVKVYDDALTPDECAHLIQYFEDSPNKTKGAVWTSDGRRLKEDVKNAWQVNINMGSEEDRILMESTGKLIRRYAEFGSYPPSALTDAGYHLKRYNPGEGFYDWHTDNSSIHICHRVVVILWYLNEIEEGGHTQFGWGEIIRPKTGAALMFPATWLYPHKGHMPMSGPKYVASTWVGYKVDGQ